VRIWRDSGSIDLLLYGDIHSFSYTQLGVQSWGLIKQRLPSLRNWPSRESGRFLQSRVMFRRKLSRLATCNRGRPRRILTQRRLVEFSCPVLCLESLLGHGEAHLQLRIPWPLSQSLSRGKGKILARYVPIFSKASRQKILTIL
jgi:hypothetical protein